MHKSPTRAPLAGLPLLLWAAVFAFFLFHGLSGAVRQQQPLFFVLAAAAQSGLLILPAWLLVRLAAAFGGRRASLALRAAAHVYAVGLLLLMHANYSIHALYGFYINGFVWNLLTTPGGIEAMGLTDSFYLSTAIRVVLAVAAYALAVRFLPLARLAATRPVRGARYVLPVLFLLQAGVYAYSEHTGGRQVLQVADRIPWYLSVTAKGFFTDLGVPRRTAALDIGSASARGKLDYPEIAAADIHLDRRYNIVWLVAESWRNDMLDSRIMPQTWAFAGENLHFLDHYSGGNGTRMGLFTQFYGLYGNYWFDVLDARQPPLLMDVLKRNGYTMKAFTSARFSYPEFDRTVFANFSPEQLQSYDEGKGWQRDRKNVADLLAFIDSAQQPFFSFMFFESPHANYYFPEESVIEPDYLQDFNYLDTDIAGQIDRIKARYINACHHLDLQIGRVLTALREAGRLDDTIVVITGDHGEEFMENGRWGHNSTFSEQQIRVPLVVHVPGLAPRTERAMTSHEDLPVTVLSALSDLQGVNRQKISFGESLLDRRSHDKYVVVSDWHGSTLISEEVKLVLSPKAADERGRFFSRDDRPLGETAVRAASGALMQHYLSDMPRFYRDG